MKQIIENRLNELQLLLKQAEQAEKIGIDRLAQIRAAIQSYNGGIIELKQILEKLPKETKKKQSPKGSQAMENLLETSMENLPKGEQKPEPKKKANKKKKKRTK